MGRLRAGESFPVSKKPRRRLVIAVGKKSTTGRASAGARKKSQGSGRSSDAAMPPPPPPSRVRPESAAAAVGGVTMEDPDALESSDAAMPPPPPSSRVRPETEGAAVGDVTVEDPDALDSSDAAMPLPLPSSRVRPESAAAALGGVTVEDTDALDCGVCFLPLKPPIFQCKLGHVVCSMCHDKLKAAAKCHVCGVATGGYSRCHAMDRLVESIRFPCPNAAYGCTSRTTYYDQQSHHQTCPHRPCHCPGEACGFVGSIAMLVDHFKAAHGTWPCTTMDRDSSTDEDEDEDEKDGDYEFTISLHDGFIFLVADRPTNGVMYLFLLNVVRQPHGCAISVLCIHPDNDELKGMEMQCELSYVASQDMYAKSRRDGSKVIRHYQGSTFTVECTDLSDGLPSPDECFQFVVSKPVLADGDTIKVRGRISID